MRKYSPEQRIAAFWDKVGGILAGPDDCWEWEAAVNEDGYGVLCYRPLVIRAHRFSWELHYGPIPKGMRVLHSCDNPPCVNPAHLFLGTQALNIRDMVSKGRNKFQSGEDCNLSKLSDLAVKIIREVCSKTQNKKSALARFYDVHVGTISRIVSYRQRKKTGLPK